jgi:glycerol-3-phosphate acyltransferase PlsY
MMMMTIQFILLPVFAYMLGSVPWGVILTRMFTAQDIRAKGSGNIGATNVTRVAGPLAGVLTLAADMLKGAVPVYLAFSIADSNSAQGEFYIAAVAFSAFLGHLYPLFTKFKNGGKGVATAAGCFLVISLPAFSIAILVFIIFICLCNRASAGSLAAAAVLPLAVWKTTGSEIMTGCAVLTAVFIYIRHKDNIRRILSGAEPVIW